MEGHSTQSTSRGHPVRSTFIPQKRSITITAKHHSPTASRTWAWLSCLSPPTSCSCSEESHAYHPCCVRVWHWRAFHPPPGHIFAQVPSTGVGTPHTRTLGRCWAGRMLWPISYDSWLQHCPDLRLWREGASQAGTWP